MTIVSMTLILPGYGVGAFLFLTATCRVKLLQ